uniref:Cytochrome c biogenesis protein CcsA n=1 Tax=Caulerpa lentillifera TaxID=148947 RepID=A0A345HGX9_9CHLO|nr:cytochrome c biogenesis protein CcsA [Caulerpa lentillifera]AXG75869.1 cytochrome c biogenesis protein CcsA [Caulerpa lentillifera]QKS32270.1 cytochrome c biogenesis protein CcsA [Caulerpa lentillifera]
MENWFNNFSFFILFCSMGFYWIRAFLNSPIFYFWGKFSVIGANLSMLFLLIYRGLIENHFPLSNFYEALIFLSWSLTLIHLIIEYYLKNSYKFIIGGMTTPTALFLNGFASFQLPESMQKLSPLVPALQSNWLMMHVTVMLLSYATLICGSIASIGYLFLYSQHSQAGTGAPHQLDQMSFRSISIGFPLLTLGIISGSVWANEAWGSYWSWDPKETWSLITWMIFAIYLHLRLTKVPQNEMKSAFVATGGFFVLWICFLGVNFVSKGLHSYGWFFS